MLVNEHSFIGSNENWFKKYPLESNLAVFCKNFKPFKDLINPLLGAYCDNNMRHGFMYSNVYYI